MSVKFNYDIDSDKLNLPSFESYLIAQSLGDKIKVGNFIKKYWGRLKLKITDEERDLNVQMRLVQQNNDRKVVEVDYSKIAEEDYFYWFRRSECFLNVVVPVYLLNDRQSKPTDRYRIILSPFHAAILDTKDRIIYDPSFDTLYEHKGFDTLEHKKLATLGFLFSKKDGVSSCKVLVLSEYLKGISSIKTGKAWIESFNEVLGRQAIK